jgi:hypothetical protein
MLYKRSRRTRRWLRLWRRYQYKHTTLAVLTLILFILLLDSALLAGVFAFLGDLGYLGGLLAGVLWVSFFTAVPAVVLVIELAGKLEPHWLALTVSTGATIGDWLILTTFEDGITKEWRPLTKRLGLRKFMKFVRRKYTSWILFLVGAVIVATPFPDEVGISLMGVSHLKRSYIILMCFLLNAIGVLAIVLAVNAIA